jgi:hypothetical protein
MRESPLRQSLNKAVGLIEGTLAAAVRYDYTAQTAHAHEGNSSMAAAVDDAAFGERKRGLTTIPDRVGPKAVIHLATNSGNDVASTVPRTGVLVNAVRQAARHQDLRNSTRSKRPASAP